MLLNAEMSPFALTIKDARYAWTLPNGKKETWPEIAHRVPTHVMGAVGASRELTCEIEELIANRIFIPGGRYLAAAGLPFHQVQNCLMLFAEDSREGWAELSHNAMMALMTGAGIGVVYSRLRPEGSRLSRIAGYSSGPIPLMEGINSLGRAAKQGGSRRAAIWAGLHWNHPDIFKFIRLKDWLPEVEALKLRDPNFPAPMDHTNISVILDDDFFRAYLRGDSLAHDVYWTTLEHACRTGDPGFSIDVGKNAGEHGRNACTELTTRDDSDICNLGSINLARIESVSQFHHVVGMATAFLVAGTVYSDVPYEKVRRVREKNRRLGLGLMGIHEYLLKQGKQYGDSFDDILETYAAKSDSAAKFWASHWGLSQPIGKRAIAPVGTIGIIGETTTGIEPVFCNAFKRTYHNHGAWDYQYVIDPTTKRLVQAGIPIDKIEDAYTLSRNVERRVAFQAYVQKHVDHGISSTINMPRWGSEWNNPDTVRTLGEKLMPYLPQLRGITVYPDGARSGQPIQPADFNEALKHEGKVFTESVDVCDMRGGSCGA